MKFPVYPFSLFVLLMATFVHAEEGGSGHYVPGSMASFTDGVGPAGTFLMRYNMLSYTGSLAEDKQIPMAGIIGEGADVTSWAHGLTSFAST